MTTYAIQHNPRPAIVFQTNCKSTAWRWATTVLDGPTQAAGEPNPNPSGGEFGEARRYNACAVRCYDPAPVGVVHFFEGRAVATYRVRPDEIGSRPGPPTLYQQRLKQAHGLVDLPECNWRPR